ncbi:hypothetical protein VTJ04DRAFT_1731 [Mycothermus thermophilus]|uniref:uncharacterized protein n=1 Tax=Humicola insolens TaxID=85995 RepID=UPI0037447E4D
MWVFRQCCHGDPVPCAKFAALIGYKPSSLGPLSIQPFITALEPPTIIRIQFSLPNRICGVEDPSDSASRLLRRIGYLLRLEWPFIYLPSSATSTATARLDQRSPSHTTSTRLRLLPSTNVLNHLAEGPRINPRASPVHQSPS